MNNIKNYFILNKNYKYNKLNKKYNPKFIEYK